MPLQLAVHTCEHCCSEDMRMENVRQRVWATFKCPFADNFCSSRCAHIRAAVKSHYMARLSLGLHFSPHVLSEVSQAGVLYICADVSLRLPQSPAS